MGLPFSKVLDVFRTVSHSDKVELIVIPVEPVMAVTVDRKMSKNGKLVCLGSVRACVWTDSVL